MASKIRAEAAVFVVCCLLTLAFLPPSAAGQAADNPQQDRALVDQAENGLIEKIAESGEKVVDQVGSAMEDEAQRDLRQIEDAASAGVPPRPVATTATTPIPTEAQTLDELAQLEKEAQSLDADDD